MKSPNRTVRTIAILALAAAAGCGGSQSSKKDMTTLASDAPPPPPGGDARMPPRDISGEAKKDFSSAVSFYLEQGKGGWSVESCQAAARRFEQVAQTHGKLVEARYNAGLSYQNCRMMKDAEQQYQAALSIHSSHAPSLSNLGQIYFLGGNEARAKQYWEKAVAADKKIAGARNNLAWLMIRQLRDKKTSLQASGDQILAHLRSVLAVENDNVEAYVLLALFYMEGSEKNKSRLTLAKLLLDEATKRNDKFAPLHNARGLIELRNDNVAQALEHFQRAVALNDDFVEARMNVANVVLGFRKYEEAAQQFNQVIERQPKSYDAIVGLGIAQRGLKQLDQAEQSYKKAADLDGARAEAYFNLGVLYKDFRANTTENLRGAQEAYRAAIKFFREAQGKPNAERLAVARDARDNISDCEKNIKQLDDAIRFQQTQPAGGAKPASAGGAK